MAKRARADKVGLGLEDRAMRWSAGWLILLVGGVGCQLVGDFEELRPGFTGAGGAGSGTNSTSAGSGMGSSSGCVNNGSGGGGHLWSAAYGDEFVQNANSITIISNSPIIVGDFSGALEGITPTAPQSLGGRDAFALRFESTGKLAWGKGFGGTGEQFGNWVSAISATNIAFAGTFQGTLDPGGGNVLSTIGSDFNAFLVRLNDLGNYLGAVSAGDSMTPQRADRIATTSSTIYTAGIFNETIDFGSPCNALTGGSDDLFVGKLTASSLCVWAKALSGTNMPFVGGMSVDNFSDTIVTGGFTGALSCPNQSDINSIATNKTDLFVLKLQANDGSCVWAKRFGDQEEQKATAITVDKSNNIIVAGNYSGTLDFGLAINNPKPSMGSNLFVAKLNSSGVPTWAISFPSQSLQNVKAISIDSNGNPIITGSFQGSLELPGLPPLCSASMGSNVFLMKLNGANGSPMWAKSFGDDQNQEGTGVAVDSSNNIWITGNFDGALNFGGNTLNSKGQDIFVAKFAP